jgi:anaerobic magnesium-protoporphyrin IX monomethyl ester cyclase
MVILYNPTSNAKRKPMLPISLLALGALLEGRHEYRIVDGNLEADPLEAVDKALRETGARFLGVTVMPGPQLNEAVPVCRELKRRHPDVTIIWGGYFPTQHFEACLRSDYVDYVVRGHGEIVLRELLDVLTGGGDPGLIHGIAYRSGPGRRLVSTPAAPIPDPDDMPDYPYGKVGILRYIRSTFLGSRTLSHHSSYGCPFFCNFCAVVNMVNGRWLPQSAERTASVVHMMARTWGVNAIEFFDNNFFTHEARTAEFSERIRNAGIGWWGEARIDTMLKYSERTWGLMRDSGLKMVFLGAESGSDETLKRMDKGGTASVAKTLEIAATMKSFGIIPEMSFVLGNPPEPEADMIRTMEFIREVKRVNPATEIILYLYTPVPLSGTLFEEAKAEGFAFPETLEEWVSQEWRDFSQRRSTNVPWLADPVRRRIRDFQLVVNAYFPTATDPDLGSLKRMMLRGSSAWRYRTRFYAFPIELRLLQKVFTYQRPETSGF